MFWIVVLQKTFESPLNCKEDKPVNPKGNQLWIFIGKTDAESKALILWPPDMKSWLIEKDCDAGKDWGQEEKGQQKMRLLAGIIDSMDVNFSRLQETVKDREPGALHPWSHKVWQRFGDWTEQPPQGHLNLGLLCPRHSLVFSLRPLDNSL